MANWIDAALFLPPCFSNSVTFAFPFSQWMPSFPLNSAGSTSHGSAASGSEDGPSAWPAPTGAPVAATAAFSSRAGSASADTTFPYVHAASATCWSEDMSGEFPQYCGEKGFPEPATKPCTLACRGGGGDLPRDCLARPRTLCGFLAKGGGRGYHLPAQWRRCSRKLSAACQHKVGPELTSCHAVCTVRATPLLRICE